MEPDRARGRALHFLGWGRPAVVEASGWLLARARRDALLPVLADLSDTLVVTPTSRGGRVLDALLAREAFERGLAITPPRFTTPERMLEVLWSSALPAASALARAAAWARALERADARVRAAFLPNLDADPDTHQRLRVGAALDSLSTTLAWGLLRAGDVAAKTQGDTQRWEALAQVQDAYERELAAAGWCDPLLAWGRESASGWSVRGGVSRVVLVCVPELPLAARAALRGVERVDALAPGDAPDAGEGLDELGCVRREHWETREVVIPDGVLEFSGTWREQAWRATELVLSAGANAVLGVCDPDMVPTLRRAAEALGSRPVHDPAGLPLARTEAARAVLALLELLREWSVVSLALLTRMPRVEQALERLWEQQPELRQADAGWHDAIDRVLEDMVDARLPDAASRQDTAGAVLRVMNSVEALLGTGSLEPSPKSATEWRALLREFVERVAPELDEAGENDDARAGRPDAKRAATLLRGVVDDCCGCAALLADGGVLSVEQFGALLEHALARAPAAPFEHGRESIEALGWLELLLDPAENLVLTGAHEGRLPTRAEPVLMLPDALASRLGLACNGSRRARDAAILSTLLRSRQVRVICGRQDAEGDAVWPGRLLLAERAEVIASRLRTFLRSGSQPAPRGVQPAEAGRFALFPMVPSEPLRSISVTAFRQYLESPYLFYLRHVLGLRERSEPQGIMSTRHFGVLVHRAAQALAGLSREDSVSPERTHDFLRGALTMLSRDVVGSRPTREVQTQLVIVRHALDALARVHAARAREGWFVEHVEWSPREASMLVDGAPMELRGRIDRIERHAETGELAIIDLKTGADASPEKTHRDRSGAWIDLQLPLYRHLASELARDTSREPELAFVLVPANGTPASVERASWSPEELRDADEAAANVIRGVREGRFAPTGNEDPYEAVYAALCGVPLGGEDASDESDRSGREGGAP